MFVIIIPSMTIIRRKTAKDSERRRKTPKDIERRQKTSKDAETQPTFSANILKYGYIRVQCLYSKPT